MKFIQIPIRLKQLPSLFALLALIHSLGAQAGLSDKAQISLLTCSPSDEAVFTVYGHTAIRVSDPLAKLDYVFNYGIFEFAKSNFIYRFAKGETDYRLGITYFENFLAEYAMRGSGITEQVLDLTPKEKNKVWEALQINALPENVTYRYNFFYDNCATRPVALIESSVDGEVRYHHEPQHKSFRTLINYYMRNQPWLIFGCQLALGSPADREATLHEEFFLPLLLEKAFDKATIQTPGGERPLVAETKILQENNPVAAKQTILTPGIASLLFLGIITGLTFLEWRKKKHYPLVDCCLFTLAGLGGTVLFFLAFVSEHPATWPNWSVVWLHPLHLPGVILFAVKTQQKAASCYHFINFATLTLLLAGWYFIPQHFHIAFIPLVICLWMRSGRYVARQGTRNL
ncbi:MAG: DUF4105 domain-containing protein [Tannerellaceae bacterium]|jgi:hypothetical protein|nr:DUF4105 domain-containing protein [Tannerellaceae bacterium]